MEVQVEAMPGWEVPKGFFVGVRLGEAVKQRRLDVDTRSASSFIFQKQDARRRAKIDIYRHVGSCSVAVDPSNAGNDEVSIPCSDPTLPNVQLRITSKATEVSAEEQQSRRRTEEQELKGSAMNYLAAHGIEQALAESVRLLLKTRPEDPFGFLCSQLQSASAASTASAASKPRVEQATKMWKEVSSWSLPEKPEAREVERRLGKALVQLDGDLAGLYLPLPSSRSWPLMPEGMPDSWTTKLRKEGLLFEASEPSGRGIFVSHREDFVLWINSADHMTLLMRSGDHAEAESVLQALKQKLGAA